MKETPPLFGRVLSLLVVWAISLSAFLAIANMGTTPNAQAASLCSQSSPVIGSDWTIPPAANELCEGTFYTMTGSLTVQGTLELKNGGIRFAQTPTDIHSVIISGTLILNNAIITVTGDTINPYLLLNFQVNNGRLEMKRGSILAFPGTFAATSGTVSIDESSITSLDPMDVLSWVGTSNADANNDAPAMNFISSRIELMDSSITNIFEQATITDDRRAIRLSGSTEFIAINSHIDIDFSNATNADMHNTIRLSDTARAYLLWPTLDNSENPPSVIQYSNAIEVTAVTAAAFIYREAEVIVVDSRGVPVHLASLRITYSGTTNDATYPDNVLAIYPSTFVLNYLGNKTQFDWKITNEAGQAIIPLVSDEITMSGTSFWGNYNITATYSGNTASKQVSVAHWPSLNHSENHMEVVIVLPTLIIDLPDLKPKSISYVPLYPKKNETVTLDVTVENIGNGGARNVLVRVYDNIISPASRIHEENILNILPVSTYNLASFLWRPTTGGTHLIIVIMDPLNTVIEADETNNQNSFPLGVTPLGPDLEAVVPTISGFAGNPIRLNATINNKGDMTAKGVIVNFYIGSLNTLIGTNSSIPDIPVNGSVQVGFNWVPPSVGVYTFYAWADPYNVIPEPLPYSETDNWNYSYVYVDPAPNPTAYSDELWADDPYPQIGTNVVLSAVVRNIGQADITGSFNVRFSVDGSQIADVPTTAMPVGDRRTISTSATWKATTCGYHPLQVDVDSRNVVAEGAFYEADNNVTRYLQVFQAGALTYNTDQTLKYLPVAQNIIITGNLVIEDGSIIVTQPQEDCGRVFIKILSGGSLTLINSTLTARDSGNWPLVVYVAGNGRFTASQNSQILLNTAQGDGILEVAGNGVIELTDTVVNGDISAHGSSATFNRVTFQGKKLHVDTQNIVRIWDPVFQGTTYLALRSDDKNIQTPDVDLRNATLNSVLTNQLTFGGNQFAQLTEVSTTKVTRWWEGTITQKAKVTRYWWLTLETVDGTGAILRADANANITLTRLNTVTLQYNLAPAPVPGIDIYLTMSTSWPVRAPEGYVIYRAASEDRYANVSKQWMNATYQVTGTAMINGTLYLPNENITGFVDHSMTFTLVFSRLTPDLSVTSISFSGLNGASTNQPINKPMSISATIRNTGEIDVPVVWVNFYFIDVDTNNDGLMDLPNISYAPEFIGSDKITVPLNGSTVASIYWDMPTGIVEISYTISVVVDTPIANPGDGGPIKETNELNNILKNPLTLYTWPDLHIETGQVNGGQAIQGVQGNKMLISVLIKNVGTNDATGVTIELTVDYGPTPVNTTSPFSVTRAGITTVYVGWRPLTVGQHNLTFTVKSAAAGPIRNIDYNTQDNNVTVQAYALSSPDLAIKRSDYPLNYIMTSGASLTIPVKVYNEGETDATLFSVGIYVKTDTNWPPDLIDLLVAVHNRNLTASTNMTLQITVPSSQKITALGAYNFTIFVDSQLAIGEFDESNNAVNVTVFVRPPAGSVSITLPPTGKEFEPGVTMTVQGSVLTSAGEPLRGLSVDAFLRDSNNNIIGNHSGNTDNGGAFILYIAIPSNTPDGTYTLTVSSPQTEIAPQSVSIIIEKEIPWWDLPILGLPLWLFLLIIIVIVVVVVAVVVYTKVVGLGKMVECGECGAFIPEDSTKCPKCGVEFEKDMAKCSNCQAWIPLDVKQCPECGVEFATGEVEMADYEQKMKVQYNEVKTKFRQQAEAELGRPLTDQEFNDWWRRQPSFVTFEDWLREEEEMRKMGSKPCPTCRTLNSITATVCHRCGTLLREEGEPKKPARPPRREIKKEVPEEVAEIPPEEAPTAEPRPIEPVPKKVVVKKPVTPTVVQKKVVVKKPVEEKEESESEEYSGE